MILDGDLLCEYLSHPLSTQTQLIKSIGSDRKMIYDDFLEVFEGLEYF